MILLYLRRLKIAEFSKKNILKYAQTFDENLTSFEPLKIEASGRKYFRVASSECSYVISYDDRPVNGQLVFINRANELLNCNVRAPKIFQYDAKMEMRPFYLIQCIWIELYLVQYLNIIALNDLIS